MKFIDLFAGIGGFRSGLEQAGNVATVPVVRAIGEKVVQNTKEENK